MEHHQDDFNEQIVNAIAQARQFLYEKIKSLGLNLSEENIQEILHDHFPASFVDPRDKLQWNDLDEAVEHFLSNGYKPLLKATPRQMRSLLYEFSRNKKRDKLSDSKKMLMLFMANYDVHLTEEGIIIKYPREVRPEV